MTPHHITPAHVTQPASTTAPQHHSTTAPQHQRCSVCHPAQAQPPAEGQPPHIPANHAARLHRVRARCDSVAFPLPHPFAHWRSVTDLRRAVSPVTRCASPPHTSHRKNKKIFRAFCARPQKAGRQPPPPGKSKKNFRNHESVARTTVREAGARGCRTVQTPRRRSRSRRGRDGRTTRSPEDHHQHRDRVHQNTLHFNDIKTDHNKIHYKSITWTESSLTRKSAL